MAAPRLRIRNLNKSFSVPVLTDINLTVECGEIHGLVGENGAGKTTLGSILAGFISRDDGRIMLDGAEYEPSAPKDAVASGISCAAQELSLIDTLSVAENIALRKLPHNCSVITRKELAHRPRSLLRTVGLGSLEPDTPTGALGLAERQLVEFAKSIFLDCKVLILDEPTAALTAHQASLLHRVITGLAASGTSVIYISHRLQDVLEVSDTVTVLRDGRVVTTAAAGSMGVADLMEYMSGDFQSGNSIAHSASVLNPEPVLEVEHMTTVELPHEISFTAGTGEIIGIVLKFHGRHGRDNRYRRVIGIGSQRVIECPVRFDPVDGRRCQPLRGRRKSTYQKPGNGKKIGDGIPGRRPAIHGLVPRSSGFDKHDDTRRPARHYCIGPAG